MSAPGSPAAVPRLGDLLAVPAIRTVVRLSDAGAEEGRRELASSFVLTEMVERHLEGVLALLARGEGGAGFVVGNYGTGKSHFLAFLSALATDPAVRRGLAEAAPGLGPRLRELDGRRLLVLRVSLVDYASRERIEDLVFSAWAGALGSPLPIAASRSARADELFAATHAAGFGGVVVLLDELSEFLRSKPDGAAFTEDVRTLQLLGEVAQDRPLLVLGSLQEQIEATGDLSPETLNKIKDRFRLRLFLKAEHLEQIVSTRLLRRRPGAEETIAGLARRVSEALPDLAVSRERLERLWPVHPATLSWLDELREFFSRQRGALDFVCAQLRGDPARGEPGRLDRPADELLTPDILYDHFVPRLVEEPELRPYHEVVMGWWQREGAAAVPESLRGDATRALKLLLLAAISPARRPLGPGAVMDALVLAKSRIDPAANRRYADGLCAALARAGTFIRQVEGPDGEPAFAVDYRADASLAVGRRLAEEERRLGPDDRRPFWMTARWSGAEGLPLDTLLLGRTVQARWQNTLRNLDARLADLDEIDAGEIDRMLADLQAGRADGVLLLATAAGVAAQRRHLDEEILPRLRAAPGRVGRAIALYLPAPLDDDAAGALRRAFAYERVTEGLQGDGSEAARAARAYVQGPHAEARRRAQTALAAAYAAGEVHGAEGLLLRPAERGPLSFDQLAVAVAEVLCAGRYPRHPEIRPGSDQFGVEALEAGLGEFVRGGAEGPLSVVARRVVQDLYVPLGIARLPRGRTSANARPVLDVSPAKNQIVAEFLDCVRRHAPPGSRRAPVEAVERDLRTGPFGMCAAQMRALALALIHTGHVTAYTGGRLRKAEDVSALVLRNVTELGLGEVVDGELWRRVTALPLVPARFRGVPPTVPLQAELVGALTALRTEARELGEAVRRAVERCRGYRSLEGADLVAATRDADATSRLARAIEEGDGDAAATLEALDRAGQAEPDLAEALVRTRRRAAFFAEKLDACARLHDYLWHPGLRVPEEPRYADLADLLHAARATLGEEAAALDGGFGTRSGEAFETFRAAWAERYLREHGGLADDPRFGEIEALRRSEAYRLLARLGDLPGLSADNDQIAIDRELAAARARRCLRLRAETLHQRPICDCGFRLGDGLDLPEPSALEERILDGLHELETALLQGPPAESLRAAAHGLRAIGRASEARTISALLEHAAPDRAAPAAAILGLARQFAAADAQLREALRAPVEILERDGDALLARLAGRTMTVEAARGAVEAWLEGDGAPMAGAYVRVSSALLAPADGLSRAVQETAERRFPELGTLARRPDELLMLAALARTARDHGARDDRWMSLARREDLLDRQEGLAVLGDALLDESAEGPALAVRASDLCEPFGIEALSRALVAEDAPEALIEAVATERTLPGLLRALARRFLRAAEATDGPLPSVPAAPAAGPVAELGAELLGACAARGRLRAAAREVASRLQDKLPGARALTELYVEHLWSAERDAARVERLARRHDLLDPAGVRALRGEARSALAQAEGAFSAVCADRYESWLEDGRGGPTFLPRAFETARARVQTDVGAAPVALVLVDALRLDVWRALRIRLEAGPPPGAPGRSFRVLFEATAWAHRPTTTAVNLAALRGQAPPPNAACDAAGGRSDTLDPLLGRMVHLRSLDLRVHHAREAPDLVVEEAAAELHHEIGALAEDLPPRSVLLLIADHGFVEARDYDASSPHATPRYRHGGDSPFELIVPVAAVLRF